MSENTVVELKPEIQQPGKALESKLIIGTYPIDDQGWQNMAWQIIYPGLMEIASESHGDWSPVDVRIGMFNKAFWVFLGYMDDTGQATPDKFQQLFAEKIRTPEKDYVGFTVVEPFRRKGDRLEFHIFAVYILPKYRNTNVLKIGLQFIETEMKKLKHSAVSCCTRPDVQAAMETMGYKAAHMTYRKNLTL